MEQNSTDLQIEQVILASILTDNTLYSDFSGLNPNDFSSKLHSVLFREIQQRLDSGALVDEYILVKAIGDIGTDELNYIADIINKSKVHKSLLKGYADLIKQASTKRKFKSLAQTISNSLDDKSNSSNLGDMITDFEKEFLSILRSSESTQKVQTLSESVEDCCVLAQKIKTEGLTFHGVTSGIASMDSYFLGMNPGNLIILAARPGMGKTALALNIGFNCAKAHSLNQIGGAPVLFFSLEMTHEELAWRIISSDNTITQSEVLKGNVTEKDLDDLYAFKKRTDDIQFIIDESSTKLSEICSQARYYKRTQNIGLIIIDYLQLMSTGKHKNELRVQELTEITRTLKALAKELNLPIIALSQLSRAVENRTVKKPTLSDLRESGSIEQDADIVMFLFREAYYLELSKPSMSQRLPYADWYLELEKCKNKAELIIAKFRRGKVGSINLEFEGERYLFKDSPSIEDNISL